MSGRLLHIERNFFGVVRVTHDAEQNVNRLFHGSTLHGQQSLDPALRREPSTYFTRSGPIGQVFRAMEARWNRAGRTGRDCGTGGRERWRAMLSPASAGRSTRSTPPWSGLPAIRGSSPICAIARPMPSKSFWAMPASAWQGRPMGPIG